MIDKRKTLHKQEEQHVIASHVKIAGVGFSENSFYHDIYYCHLH